MKSSSPPKFECVASNSLASRTIEGQCVATKPAPICSALLAVVFFVLALSDHAWALQLVGGGKSKYIIHYAINAPSSVELAAQELQGYIEKATGVSLNILRGGRPTSPCICLGSNVVAKAETLQGEDIALEGYRIITRGENLFILGNDLKDGQKTSHGGSSNGTLNGAYTFLEDYVGVRWLMPGEKGEFVPKRRTLNIPIVDRTEKPGFEYRILAYVQEDNPDVKVWLRRQKQGYSLQLYHYHNWQNIVPASEFSTHPDWFPLIDGKRQPPVERYKLETTNPGLVDYFSQRVTADLKKQPGLYSYSISPTDSGQWSESRETQALHDRDPRGNLSLSRLVVDFYNNVAKRVGEVVPDRLLCGYIYANYLYPITGSAPSIEPNLCLVIAPSFSYGYGLYSTRAREELRDIILKWRAATPNVVYYDLPTVFFSNSVGAPNPPGVPILKFLYPMLSEAKLRGNYVYGVTSWGQGALTNYLLAKLNWNPNADVNASVSDFLVTAYGSNAAPILEGFFRKLDAQTASYFSGKDKGTESFKPDTIKEIFVPLLKELDRNFGANLYTLATPEQRYRLDALAANLVRFHRYLRPRNLIPSSTMLSAYPDLDSEEQLLIRVNDPLMLPVSASASAEKQTIKLGDLRVASAPAIRNAPAAGAFTLRGSSRILLRPKDGKIIVKTAVIRDDGEISVYRVKDTMGRILVSGELANSTIRADAQTGSFYLLEIDSAASIYRIDIVGAEVLYSTEAQRRGLHLFDKLAPLYIHSLPAASSLKVILSSDAPGEAVAADLYSPSGRIAASLDTSGAGSAMAAMDKPESGFWTVMWKQPAHGAVSDAWLKLDGGGTKWVTFDPLNPLVVTGESH